MITLPSLALVKLNYMRETPQKPSSTNPLQGSKNLADTGTIRREGFWYDAGRTLRDFTFSLDI